MAAWLATRWKTLRYLYQKEIWQNTHLRAGGLRGGLYAFLRVISITWTVFLETKAPARAAALSFSSLLGIGPLIAIAVLIGGFVLGNNSDPDLVANKVSELIQRAVPQLDSLDTLDPLSDGTIASAVNPELVAFINGIIAGARSGSAGIFGVISLIFIVLLLFKSVEDAFNDIWGVRLGRTLLMRVVFYWTILTLGAVLFFGSIALLGAGAYVNVFNTSITSLPGGQQLLAVLQWSLPLFSTVLLVCMLTLVYRVIPNTHVFWRAAFIGGLVVTAFLLLNNFVAFFYVRRVLLTKSLYGSLALPIVLMLGLYVFWLYLLIGGIISYAVQNVHFRNSQAAWGQLTESMRERLSLVVLLTIARRFHGCLPPISAPELGDLLKTPTQVINECLNRLVRMQLVSTVESAPEGIEDEHRYQPARPLSRITLWDFKRLDDDFGEDPVGTSFERVDPVMPLYNAAVEQLGQQALFQQSLEQLLNEHTFDESRPPFALGDRPTS